MAAEDVAATKDIEDVLATSLEIVLPLVKVKIPELPDETVLDDGKLEVPDDRLVEYGVGDENTGASALVEVVDDDITTVALNVCVSIALGLEVDSPIELGQGEYNVCCGMTVVSTVVALIAFSRVDVSVGMTVTMPMRLWVKQLSKMSHDVLQVVVSDVVGDPEKVDKEMVVISVMAVICVVPQRVTEGTGVHAMIL